MKLLEEQDVMKHARNPRGTHFYPSAFYLTFGLVFSVSTEHKRGPCTSGLQLVGGWKS